METSTGKIIKGQQIEGTPAENIKEFEVDGNMVKAVFWKKEQAIDYINKYSCFDYSETWYDKIGFADFSVNDNVIVASSTYHPTDSMIKMFQNGLKHL